MKTYKTSGDFMLIDPQTRVVFEPGLETESNKTPFVIERLKNGNLIEVGGAAPAPAPAPAAPAPHGKRKGK